MDLSRNIPPLNGLGALAVWKCHSCRLTQLAEPEDPDRELPQSLSDEVLTPNPAKLITGPIREPIS